MYTDPLGWALVRWVYTPTLYTIYTGYLKYKSEVYIYLRFSSLNASNKPIKTFKQSTAF